MNEDGQCAYGFGRASAKIDHTQDGNVFVSEAYMAAAMGDEKADVIDFPLSKDTKSFALAG